MSQLYIGNLHFHRRLTQLSTETLILVLCRGEQTRNVKSHLCFFLEVLRKAKRQR